ncbi:hypothetical protein GIB67_008369 [Kingdonia uniflora]|uniref:Uncharacterized protein n=1 Tax=Kingdonia uniflora TaxID=39325 RepID=A0A7J7N5F0_9MAGN|nr:hypothetical protein GIB67_008369 [Kingdonia uniflora]
MIYRNSCLTVTVNVDYAWAIPLNRTMKEGDLVSTKMILDGRPSAVRMSIISYGETTIFKAALSGNLPFVKELVKVDGAGGLRNKESPRDHSLIAVELLPLIVAAINGNKDMVHYLYKNTSKEELKLEMSKNGIDFVITSIIADLYDLALDILNKYEKLVVIPDKFGVTTMPILARKTSVLATMLVHPYYHSPRMFENM